jgi:hypothetical protein
VTINRWLAAVHEMPDERADPGQNWDEAQDVPGIVPPPTRQDAYESPGHRPGLHSSLGPELPGGHRLVTKVSGAPGARSGHLLDESPRYSRWRPTPARPSGSWTRLRPPPALRFSPRLPGIRRPTARVHARATEVHRARPVCPWQGEALLMTTPGWMSHRRTTMV